MMCRTGTGPGTVTVVAVTAQPTQQPAPGFALLPARPHPSTRTVALLSAGPLSSSVQDHSAAGALPKLLFEGPFVRLSAAGEDEQLNGALGVNQHRKSGHPRLIERPAAMEEDQTCWICLCDSHGSDAGTARAQRGALDAPCIIRLVTTELGRQQPDQAGCCCLQGHTQHTGQIRALTAGLVASNTLLLCLLLSRSC
jgi:hypothetical protein